MEQIQLIIILWLISVVFILVSTKKGQILLSMLFNIYLSVNLSTDASFSDIFGINYFIIGAMLINIYSIFNLADKFNK